MNHGPVTHDSVVGMDLGGTTLLLRCGTCEETLGTGPTFTPAQLIRHLQSFLARHAIIPAGIGLAVPGLVEVSGRIAECDVLPAFTGWQARHSLQDFCAKAVVLNDVDAALLDEMHDTPPDFTGGVIMIGTAIGAAFITNGARLRGAGGWAGELGYLPIVVDDNIRRLDEVAGGAAIAAACGVAPTTLAGRARDGDPDTLRAIARAGTLMGLGLAAVINLLNPSRLSIGGGTCTLPGYWTATLGSAAQHALPSHWRDCTIKTPGAGQSVVALGAIRAANPITP